jgi:hypothetical protein
MYIINNKDFLTGYMTLYKLLFENIFRVASKQPFTYTQYNMPEIFVMNLKQSKHIFFKKKKVRWLQKLTAAMIVYKTI